MTVGQMADWWQYRSQSGWSVADGRPRIVHPNIGSNMEFQPELVTGYRKDGFIVERLSN